MDYEFDFLKSLLFTITVETIALLAFTKKIIRNNNTDIRLIILAGIVASMATLPYLWFIFPLFLKNKLWYSLLSEVSAILIETFIIYGILKLSLKKSFFASLICNSSSYLLGVIFSII